ncbi:hypothetical protein AHAS_Ahas15G0111400 [Arachis hypogaea]
MNRVRLRRKVIVVQEAKYKRPSEAAYVGKVRAADDKYHRPDLEPQREEGSERSLATANGLQTNVRAKSMFEKCELKNVECVMAIENLEWLRRSLVGETLEPIDLVSLRKMVARSLPSVVQVRKMEACKALLTFDSDMHANETYTFNLNSLLHTFHRVWKWKESERCESRRVWLECLGVPLFAWSADTFKRIGSQWGAVVRCAKETELCSTLTTGHVLIDTSVMEAIQEKIQITVGLGGYDVLVKDIGLDACDMSCHGTITDMDIAT